MSADLQTLLALAIVAVSIALLVWSSLRKHKKPGCGGGCGCPTDQFKKQLKSVD